jgi:hypothetical protein
MGVSHGSPYLDGIIYNTVIEEEEGTNICDRQ